MKDYKLVFSEDFSSGLDVAKWSFREDTVKSGKQEKQHFEPAFALANSSGAFKPHNDLFYKKENVEVKDGKLYVTCKRCGDGYSSGSLKLNDLAVRDGYMEIVAKAPIPCKGIMPCVQAVTAEASEDDFSTTLDFMFVPGESDISYANMRTSSIDKSNGNFAHVKWLAARTFAANTPDDSNISENFHTYAVRWCDDELTFMFDGRDYKTVCIDHPSFVAFRQERTISIELQVGSVEIPAPDETNVFPNSLVIDSIKIYSK